MNLTGLIREIGLDDIIPSPRDQGVVEILADYAHRAWSGWMLHMFMKSALNPDGTVTIPADLVTRWKRQAATFYQDLPEGEKESDRKEARKMLALL